MNDVKKIFYSDDPSATLFEHHGYRGSVEYSEDEGVFHGKILDIDDLILYKSDSVDDMEFEFFRLVDNYIETCKIREIRKGLEKFNFGKAEHLKIKPIKGEFLRYLYNERFLKLCDNPDDIEEGGAKWEEYYLLLSVMDEYDELTSLKYTAKLAEEAERRKDEMLMPFGKYKGRYVEDIFTDVEHTRWCLKQTFVFYDYPELYHNLKTLYDTIREAVESTMYLYCLVLSNDKGVKIGKTKQYVPKRLYNEVCSTTNYSQVFKKNPVEIKKSFVFKTCDLDIEKELKAIFKPFRIHKTELFNVNFNTIQDELDKRVKENQGFFYYKKPLYDFIPYGSLQDLRKDFVIYLDRHVHFKAEYESHLMRKGLYKFYDPDFVCGSLN